MATQPPKETRRRGSESLFACEEWGVVVSPEGWVDEPGFCSGLDDAVFCETFLVKFVFEIREDGDWWPKRYEPWPHEWWINFERLEKFIFVLVDRRLW